MKLQEVIETVPTLTPPIDITAKDRTPTTASGQRVGGGLYSAVYDQTPFSVLKTMKENYQGTNLEHDAYFQYLLMVVKDNKFDHNPYFPRIHDLIVYKDTEHLEQVHHWDSGKMIQRPTLGYQVEIEKLAEFPMLNDREAIAITNKMFKNMERKIERSTDPRWTLITTIEKTMKKRVGAPHIKDPLYAEAVELVRSVREKRPRYFMYDLHQYNIMIRRGRYIPQIVITDPLSDSR